MARRTRRWRRGGEGPSLRIDVPLSRRDAWRALYVLGTYCMRPRDAGTAGADWESSGKRTHGPGAARRLCQDRDTLWMRARRVTGSRRAVVSGEEDAVVGKAVRCEWTTLL